MGLKFLILEMPIRILQLADVSESSFSVLKYELVAVFWSQTLRLILLPKTFLPVLKHIFLNNWRTLYVSFYTSKTDEPMHTFRPPFLSTNSISLNSYVSVFDQSVRGAFISVLVSSWSNRIRPDFSVMESKNGQKLLILMKAVLFTIMKVRKNEESVLNKVM